MPPFAPPVDDAHLLLFVACAVGAICGILLTLFLRAVCCSSAVTSPRPVVEPLLVNGQLLVGGQPVENNAGASNHQLLSPARREWGNLVFLIVFSTVAVGACGGGTYLLIAYFHVIWASGFVAALLLGGFAFAVRATCLWLYRNVVMRRFCTTMQLSRENKESTPVLEWFKVWLPRYMKAHGRQFHNVAPLFRKKDGTTYFTMFQDTRTSNQFALSLWAAQGTHTFQYIADDGSTSWVLMRYYTKGEAKKTGWNNELVAQEYIDLIIFDPLHTKLRHFVEMLERAQARARPHADIRMRSPRPR